MSLSRISSPGLASWLSGFGVTHFETQEPSDLEYDPQLALGAEGPDPTTPPRGRCAPGGSSEPTRRSGTACSAWYVSLSATAATFPPTGSWSSWRGGAP